MWQSAHVLQKRGKYYIVHFKQLFLLDGKQRKTDFTPDDYQRTKLIAKLLEEWGLIKLKCDFEVSEVTDVVVISYQEKRDWDCRSKYTIGKRF